MANMPQSKKRIRRNGRRAVINKNRLSQIRSKVKTVEAALEAGDKGAAASALAAVQPELARGVAKGLYHKNTAARKFSRLTKRIVALG
jgi:small subunit ribosomal protein S20